MRGLKPFPAPIYLGAAFLLVQVNGQGEMDCGWWWQLPLCTSFQLHRIRWGWTEWTSMTVNPEQWLLVNLRRLVCRFSSNYAGKDKCIGVIEADIVLWQSLCWPFHITKRWKQVCVLAIVLRYLIPWLLWQYFALYLIMGCSVCGPVICRKIGQPFTVICIGINLGCKSPTY